MQIDGTYADHRSEMRSEQLRDVSLSPEDRINEDRNIAMEEWMKERVSSETNPMRKPVRNETTLEGGEKRRSDKLTPETTPTKKSKIQEKNEDQIYNSRNVEETQERNHGQKKISEKRLTPEIFSKSTIREVTGVEWERRDDGQNSKPQTNDEMVKTLAEEERESQLVAGIILYKETREDNREDEKTQTVKLEIAEEKGESEDTEKEDIKNASYDESVERVNIAVGTLKPILSTVPASEIPSTIQIITVSQNRHRSSHNVHPQLPVRPTQVPPLSSLPPTPHTKVSLQMFQISLKLEDVRAKNPMLKPAQKEPQITHKAQEISIQPNESTFDPKVQGSTPKPQDAKIIAQESKEPDPTPDPKLSAKLVDFRLNTTQPKGKHNTSQLIKAGKLTKPQQTLKTQNKRSKSKKHTSKVKKSGKDDKTQKPSEKRKKAITPIHSTYFMDNYCPPECACYGR